MRGDLREGSVVACRENDIVEEVYIEEDRRRRNDVQHEEKRKEIIVNEQRSEHYFHGERSHNCETDGIKVNIGIALENGSSEVVEEQRVNGEHGNNDLVFEADLVQCYLVSVDFTVFLIWAQVSIPSEGLSFLRNVSPLLLLFYIKDYVRWKGARCRSRPVW